MDTGENENSGSPGNSELSNDGESEESEAIVVDDGVATTETTHSSQPLPPPEEASQDVPSGADYVGSQGGCASTPTSTMSTLGVFVMFAYRRRRAAYGASR